jgi:hypothetical protein
MASVYQTLNNVLSFPNSTITKRMMKEIEQNKSCIGDNKMDVTKSCINFIGDEGILQPIGNAFLFSFLSETVGGKFVGKNSGKIILTNQDLDVQGKYARWAKVTAIGSKVTDFSVGDIVLIEALKWTIEYKFNGQSYWKSDDTKVIAIGLDESVAFDY